MREAAAAGKGVVLVEGRLIENLHVENARRLLALAGEIERSRAIIEAPLGEPALTLPGTRANSQRRRKGNAELP